MGLTAAIAGTTVATAGAFMPTQVMAETAASGATVTKDKAKSIALSHAKASVSQISKYEIELKKEKKGSYYEIEFDFNGYEYEYKIDTATGAIAKWEKEPLKNYSKLNSNAAVKPEPTLKSDNSYISEAKAKDISLTHAKLKANQITDYKISRDKERGVVIYEVEFKSGGYEYDYDINAQTGAIIKVEKELKNPRQAGYTGIAKNSRGKWFFFRKGNQDTGFTGVAQSVTGNWVFARKGYVDFGYTGVAQSTSGNWVYVKNGRYTNNYTGYAKTEDGKSMYVKKGRV